MPDRKSVDVSQIKKFYPKDGLVLGESCNVTSKEQSEMFCQGVREAIDVATELIGSDKKNFQTLCQIKPMPTDIPKDLLELNNPIVNEIFSDSLINISFIDASTQKSRNFDPLYSQHEKGAFVENRCQVPEDLMAQKFCKGFEFGMNQFFEQSMPRLDTNKYKAECKLVKNEEGKPQVVYRFLHYLE
jgi:hypothetical protein